MIWCQEHGSRGSVTGKIRYEQIFKGEYSIRTPITDQSALVHVGRRDDGALLPTSSICLSFLLDPQIMMRKKRQFGGGLLYVWVA